jgi:Flp pilus assembly pilin Flp
MVLLWLYVRLQSLLSRLPLLRREEGQTTAEYALVILAAVAVAVVLIAWAKSSGKLPSFFDKIIDQVSNSA